MEWKRKYKEWLDSPNTSSGTKIMLNEMDNLIRYDSFYKYLEFGTGGMRGKIGPGINRMNILTVRRLTYSYARYLKDNSEPNKSGVVIQYDTRYQSKEFAEEVAATLSSQEIPVYLSDQPRPTPLLSFLIREFDAIGGIMITASHNPPEYNGYKVYDSKGCQILPNTVTQIVQIQQNIPSETMLQPKSFEEQVENGSAKMYGEEVEKTYVETLFKESVLDVVPAKELEDITVVYSPLHGTGTSLMQKALKNFNFVQVELVEDQLSEDGSFPTVKLPNPEEKEAFELSLVVAENKKADVIFTTDPDADRLGVAVLTSGNEYQLITGNQLGGVLIHFLLTIQKEKEKNIVIKTIVTSDFGAKIAEHNGCVVKETLTGFKYIGELINKMGPEAKEHFLFGYEESYGYLFSAIVRDKDAIQAALLTSLAVSYYKKKQKALVDVLEELFKEFGYYEESLETIAFKGQEGREALQNMINELRKSPPLIIEDKKVVRLEDYENGKALDVDTKQTTNLLLPQSDVLKFILEDESWFAIRLSGTEEKCKIYFGVKGKSRDHAHALLQQFKNEVLLTHLNMDKTIS